MNKSIGYISLSFLVFCAFIEGPGKRLPAGPPALSYIRENEIRQDLFTLADDNMRGRRAGTLDELRAGAWVAEQARKAGLEPAGDDGTYLQFYSLRRTKVAATSRIDLNGKPLALNRDVWVTTPIDSRLTLPVEWMDSMADTSRSLQGKAIAMTLRPPVPLPAKGVSLWGYRYTASAIRQQAATLRAHGASCVILVTDSVAETELSFIGHNYQDGSYQLDNTPPAGGQNARNNPVPVILVRRSAASEFHQPQASITLNIGVESFLYPSVNVVAVAKGTDPTLSKEYVLFSGHHDHDGVGLPVAGDSIWNGADDNATVTVAMLAIARAWKAKPGKRSALFVWHGAEERGLLGSRWYAEHPTVKKESIVAVLNGDMMGRNSPDSAALLGAVPPHRNSLTLVNMAMQANKDVSKFKVIDTSWDDPKHPEGWYFRSDHLSYARIGIPSIFFTTLLHPDYHTPRDEAKTIDIAKLTRMSRWMYATGWSVSETAQRPALDNAGSINLNR